MYMDTLLKSEYEYQREMRRRLDRIQHDNQDIVRRRLVNDHLFAHAHLTKRYQWYNLDKSYRNNCRIMWNKQAKEHPRSSHIFLPSIYPKENPSTIKNAFEIELNDNSIIANEKIKQKFLYTQPVMLEILNTPHSYEVFKSKHDNQLRKKYTQQQQVFIQANATDDERYTQLVSSLHKR